jgi:hypothetical protein
VELALRGLNRMRVRISHTHRFTSTVYQLD